MIAVGDLAREAAPAVLLLVELADEGPGVGRAGDDPDLWRAAEILELLHRHLASGWFGVQGQIVRHFRVRLAARWPSPRPSPRSSPPNYTLTDDPPWEGAPLSDAPARAARLAEPRRRAPLRSGGGGRREEPVRERGHPDAPAFAPRPLGAPVLGRRPGRSRHPGPRRRSAAEPVPPDSRQARAGLNLSRASPERGDHRGERAADEIERPWVQRDD